jgi:DNA-binding NarL/FixJ family response regulator
MSEQSHTCLIADDHPPVLRSISELVREWGYTIVATTSDGTEALRKLEELQPDVALVDLRMPGTSGIEIAREAARKGSVPVLIYTGFDDQAFLTEALDSGARGFILKEAPLDDLRRALAIVIAGGTYIDPVLGGHLLAQSAAPKLTEREREVLRCLAEGCSNEEIGNRLFISSETARTHISKATRKLGARTRTEAVASALRSGLIV